ncbi:hypothetical protein BSLG_008186 [Batrachochytrium salamandrivorans]|nr:hypothetical protein BSLG_008186 [Batrachochytrium salamandrivorans]
MKKRVVIMMILEVMQLNRIKKRWKISYLIEDARLNTTEKSDVSTQAIQSASFEPDDILEPTQNDLLDADGMGDEEDGTDVDRNDEADDTLHKVRVGDESIIVNLDESSAADLKDAPGSDRVKRRRLILDHLAPDRNGCLAHSQDSDHLMRRKAICMQQLVRKEIRQLRILGRIDQLKSENLWGFKQMKPHKPVSQSRTHRDYLLDEMTRAQVKLATAYTMAQWMLEWHQAVDKSTLCVKRRFTSESSMMGIIGQQSPQHIESLAVEGTDEMEVVADESGCTSDQHSINTTVSADGLVTSLLVPQCIGDNTTSTIVGTQLDPSAVGLPVLVAPSAVQPVMPQCSTSRPTAKLVTLDLEANSVVPNIESVVPVSRYTMQRIVAKQPSRWNEWGCLRTQCPPVDLVKWLPLSSRYHTTPKSVSLFDGEAQVQTGVNPSQPPMTPLKLSLMKERRDKPMFDQHRMAVFAAHLRPGPIMARPSFGAASANSALQLQAKPASVGVPAIIPISPSASASIGGDVSPTTTQRPQAQRLGHTAVAVEDVVATPPVSSQDIISATTSALTTEVAAAAVAAAAASSHSSARRRFKATGISGTQHAVSVAALAAVAANDHSADSDRSVTGLMAQMASAQPWGPHLAHHNQHWSQSRKSKSTVSATPIRGSTLPVQHDQSDMDDYDHSVGDARATKVRLVVPKGQTAWSNKETSTVFDRVC